MNMPELDWPLMVALVAVVLTVVAWVSAASLNRRLGVQQREAEQRCQALEQRLEWLQQSISGLTSGAVGMDRRVQRIEARGKVLAERQETYENQQIDEQPYGQAIRLVHQGASVHRLVDELALSESEADLIVRLHGHRDTA
jgi:uncharacterized coiled-coil protein SlyX